MENNKVNRYVRVYLDVENEEKHKHVSFCFGGIHQRGKLFRRIGWWMINKGTEIMFKDVVDLGRIE